MKGLALVGTNGVNELPKQFTDREARFHGCDGFFHEHGAMRWDGDTRIDVELIAETFSDYDAMIAYRDSLLQRH